MLKVQAIADALNRWAPSKLAEEWDNVGVLIGDPSAEVKKVLVCLDVGLPAINRANACITLAKMRSDEKC